MTKTVSVDILKNEWDLPFGGTDEIKIISTESLTRNRWSNIYRLVIFDNRYGTYWSLKYNLGTGDEGERPWEYEEEVELTRVYPKQITTTVYVEEPPMSTST